VYSTADALLVSETGADTTITSGRCGVYTYEDLASYHDNVRVSGPFCEPRYVISTIIDQRVNVGALMDDVTLSCFGRWGHWDGARQLSIDSAASSVATITDAGGGGDYPIVGSRGKSSLRRIQRKIEGPNAAVVRFYDPRTWRTEEVRVELDGVREGSDQPRELRLQTAATTPGHAYRLAKQWLAAASRARYGLTIPQHGMMLAPGDIVTLSSSVGPVTAQLCRVNSISDDADGTVSLELIEYVDGDISDDVPVFALSQPAPEQTTAAWVVFEDDFTAGTVADGNIGQLGWGWTHSLAGDPTYSTEGNHPGIINVPYINEIYLAQTSQMFAPNAVWGYRWVCKRTGDDASGQAWVGDRIVADSTGGVFRTDFRVGAGPTFDLWVNGVNTTVDYDSTAWYEASAWCGGDGVANLVVRELGGERIYQTTKAVTSTSIANYMTAIGAGAADSSIGVDYAYLMLPARQE
jgi:hypothetical protein